MGRRRGGGVEGKKVRERCCRVEVIGRRGEVRGKM